MIPNDDVLESRKVKRHTEYPFFHSLTPQYHESQFVHIHPIASLFLPFCPKVELEFHRYHWRLTTDFQ